MPTGGLDFVALATAAAEAGAVGAGVGALGSFVTGGDPLKGAEMGGLSGLGIGAGGVLGPALGLGATAGGALGGAAGGALGGAATGQNPLFGALEGAGGSLVNSALSGGFDSAPPGTSPAGGGTAGAGSAGATPGAAATAAPAGISGGGGDVSFESSFPTGVNGASSGGSEIGNALSSSSSGSGGLSAPPGGINVSTPSVDNIPAGSISAPGGSGGVSIPNAAGDNISGAGAGGGGGGGNSILKAFDSGKGSDILSALGKNSNILIPAAGLGFNAIEGNQSPKDLKTLQGQADRLAGQGGALQSYLQTGTLPPGVQGSINQAAQSAKAQIKSKYASMGASGSSAEQTELANVDAPSASQGANLALNLLQQGVNETQLSSVLYQEIMKTTMQQDQNLQSAVTNFATAAAGGGSGGTNLHITAG